MHSLQIVEFGEWSILDRTGLDQTADLSIWTAVVDVNNALGAVYNNVKADYLAVTSVGTVTAFQV